MLGSGLRLPALAGSCGGLFRRASEASEEPQRGKGEELMGRRSSNNNKGVWVWLDVDLLYAKLDVLPITVAGARRGNGVRG